METTLIEGNNISEFILKTKKMLDEVGVAITEKVLETVDILVDKRLCKKKRLVNKLLKVKKISHV